MTCAGYFNHGANINNIARNHPVLFIKADPVFIREDILIEFDHQFILGRFLQKIAFNAHVGANWRVDGKVENIILVLRFRFTKRHHR